MIPGDQRPAFEHAAQARQILNDAEDDLREWQPELEEVGNSAHRIDNSLMPISSSAGADETSHRNGGHHRADTGESNLDGNDDNASRVTSGSITTGPTYAASESEAAITAH